MSNPKTSTNLILILIIIFTSLGGSIGYLSYPQINKTDCENMGGVRSRSTGFYMNAGENLSVGTSTNLTGDIVIESNSTSTIELRKTKSATTTGSCIMADAPDGTTVYYIPNIAGTWTGSTTDICN